MSSTNVVQAIAELVARIGVACLLNHARLPVGDADIGIAIQTRGGYTLDPPALEDFGAERLQARNPQPCRVSTRTRGVVTDRIRVAEKRAWLTRDGLNVWVSARIHRFSGKV